MVTALQISARDFPISLQPRSYRVLQLRIHDRCNFRPPTTLLTSRVIIYAVRTDLFAKRVSSLVSPECERLTRIDPPPYDRPERIEQSPPPLRSKFVQPTTRPDVHRFECRKQVGSCEDAVEVFPTIGIERPSPGVVVYDRDVVHAREWRKVFKCFRPKFSVYLVNLRPKCKGR